MAISVKPKGKERKRGARMTILGFLLIITSLELVLFLVFADSHTVEHSLKCLLKEYLLIAADSGAFSDL